MRRFSDWVGSEGPQHFLFAWVFPAAFVVPIVTVSSRDLPGYVADVLAVWLAFAAHDVTRDFQRRQP